MYRIEKYVEEKKKEWDEFLENNSVNGTFLQSRNFLNYHPKERFVDASLMIYDEKDRLAVVIPACEFLEDRRKIFFSHKGSTFGGIVIAKKWYNAKSVVTLLDELKTYWKQHGYEKVFLKNTGDIFCKERTDLLQYAYFYHGFKEYKELNTYIDFDQYKENIVSNFTQGKRSHVNRCEREGLQIRELHTEEEIRIYYKILCENLQKYHVKPVHTVEELIDFKQHRLKEECGFFGCYLAEEMIAGSMMFYFHNCGTAHTQYLSAKESYNRLSPMTYMYYSMIHEMRERGFKKISFGIATEELGSILNAGLVSSKEDFGSSYENNLTYYMDLTASEEI